MRFYDDSRHRLNALYEKSDEQRRFFQSSGRYDRIKRVERRYQFTEFISGSKTPLKVVGTSISHRLSRGHAQIPACRWQSSVIRKINILGQVSSLMQGSELPRSPLSRSRV